MIPLTRHASSSMVHRNDVIRTDSQIQFLTVRPRHTMSPGSRYMDLRVLSGCSLLAQAMSAPSLLTLGWRSTSKRQLRQTLIFTQCHTDMRHRHWHLLNRWYATCSIGNANKITMQTSQTSLDNEPIRAEAPHQESAHRTNPPCPSP